ncbi:hypothetical protein N9F21_04115, partial [Porticoccaceae bacterium]|nr:hypothetical protein [Porticoccaceae bacterium]
MHYIFGGGKTVQLGDVGLGSDFQNAPSVETATSEFIGSTMQGPVFNLTTNGTAGTDVTNDGAVDSTGLPSLFSVGNGRLDMSGSCVSGACTFNFETNDNFIDAL